MSEQEMPTQEMIRVESHNIPLVTEHKGASTNVSYTDPIPLNESVLALKDPSMHVIEIKPTEQYPKGILSIYLSSTEDGKQKPIGYIVFNWQAEDPKKALLSINFMRTKNATAQIAEAPEPLRELAASGNVFDALRVEPSAQGKGLGKLLMLAGMEQMRIKGFDQIQISGDLTIGLESGADSFYSKYGAVPDQAGHEVIRTDLALQYGEYLSAVFAKK
ncbi:MAG: GNAT family N-acetyltransferase [Candidatus Roizmanbacteria bacterium]